MHWYLALVYNPGALLEQKKPTVIEDDEVEEKHDIRMEVATIRQQFFEGFTEKSSNSVKEDKAEIDELYKKSIPVVESKFFKKEVINLVDEEEDLFILTEADQRGNDDRSEPQKHLEILGKLHSMNETVTSSSQFIEIQDKAKKDDVPGRRLVKLSDSSKGKAEKKEAKKKVEAEKKRIAEEKKRAKEKKVTDASMKEFVYLIKH
jgi:hypothetical protein